ncbi:hypothetical protein S83_011433 [Arachis hypogaea]|uniref:RING-type domain-containing protein n=1 Tax=Arachis hypogaea TaxID=3818 RepID=A0A445DJ15_ARAHY|nr:E3 ubiquitin-protein ligase BOI [Arachis hypogaea]RYR63140.1 hypothetical protein Ahy_A04g020928 [Arachis hypogaea]
MAVDATYMNNLLPSQLLVNREIIRPSIQQQQQNQVLNNNSAMYNNAPQMNSALVPSNNQQQSVMQFFYQSNNNVCDPNNKTDSGLTFHQNNNNMVSLQRKRSRDLFISELFTEQQHKKQQQQQPPPFINQDVLFQFQNQTQSEIDRVLAHHTEKVRMEMEEQKIRQSRLILSLLQETMAKKLKEKDEEIQRMEKLNMALQERVKSLCVENQVWKELAHTNETTANYLRTNLEQILAHVGTGAGAGADDHRHVGADDDAESCCGSNDDILNNNEKKCGSTEEETAATAAVGGGGGGGGGEGVSRMCKSCGVRESIVLLLPCRHLCLCTMCGSSVRNCPVCDSGMDASVHVNLS